MPQLSQCVEKEEGEENNRAKSGFERCLSTVSSSLIFDKIR